MSDREGIIKKIRALLDKAESTTYEAEAESFTAKAQELMLQYAVDEAEMETAGKKKSEDIVIRDVIVKRGQAATESRQAFMERVARAFGCRTFLWGGTDRVAVVGYESDTMFVEMMYLSINVQCYSTMTREVKEAKREAKRYENSGTKFSEAGFRRAFAEGYFYRVAERIKERYEAKMANVGESTAIVLKDKGDRVEDWLNSRMSLGKAKQRRVKKYDFQAAGLGRERGNDANIGVGTKAVGRSPELPA
jgi:hypothetical protein